MNEPTQINNQLKKNLISIMTKFEELKKQYVNAAILHGQFSFDGNYKEGNKQHDLIISAYKDLRKSTEGIEFIRQLMNHHNLSVKLWSAAHSLPYHEKQAKRVLKDIQKLGEQGSIEAEYTIKEWDEGNLTFDYLDYVSKEEPLDREIYDLILSSKKENNEEKFVNSLTPEKKAIYSTIKLEDDVINGGFNQYFWNATGSDPEIASISYRLIDADKLADLVDEAVVMFMEELPRNEKYFKEKNPESFAESYKHTNLGKLDEKYHNLIETENPSELRRKYIEIHKDELLK